MVVFHNRGPRGNAGQVFGIAPSVSGITSLSFFKQFDLIFPVYAILSYFQPTYPRSRCHGTGDVRPLNRDGPNVGGVKVVRASSWRLWGPTGAQFR